jgi:translin
MKMNGVDLQSVEAWSRGQLDRKNAAREQALRWSRELVRTCANSIRAVHRHDLESAQTLLADAHALNGQICAALADDADLYWAGYVQDAQKELVEARCTFSLVQHQPLPDPMELGIAPAPFLNGLAEAVGELRRYVLDLLRRGETDGCESLLGAMDDIYALLVTLDYPDALTGGLRRSTDSARGILEKTRGDLTLALRQDALVQALRSVDRSGGDQ